MDLVYLHMRKAIPVYFILLILTGCASHPTISPQRLKPGETKRGYTLSTENLLPYLWWRKGLSDVSDVGFRIGLPIYGTGIDYSRVLYVKENKWDVLNLAWSLNPNYNMDVTYYKFKSKEGKEGFLKTRWWGLRGMYIPKGISGGTSTRMGLLYGRQVSPRWGFEFGYYHDFSSIPITKLFDFQWDPEAPENVQRFGDTPHVDPASGWPSEYARITGLSIMVFINLGAKQKSK